MAPQPEFQIFESDDVILVTGKKKSSSLRISRQTGRIELQGAVTSTSKPRNVYGIIGTVDLLTGKHLILITDCVSVGSIAEGAIFRVTGVDILRIPTRSVLQDSLDAPYLKMLNAAIGDNVYFSYDVDLTNCAQRSSELHDRPLAERLDERFVYNFNMLKELVGLRAEEFVVPITVGFVQIEQYDFDGKDVKLALISRRSRHRAGTRFNTRGADASGAVANFVETEQLVECNGQIASYVQTRGSIPLLWSQMPNLTYKPRIRLNADEAAAEAAFRKHTSEMTKRYGPVVMLDLIDQKGMEGHLGKQFAAMSQKIQKDLRYVPFDFHVECRRMRYDKLDVLMDRIRSDMDSQGFFMAKKGSAPSRLQNGVCRTNCIDCLDRTNVVQSLIGRLVFKKQLVSFGVLRDDQKIESFATVERSLKHLWANHADAISVQYSGTPALKTDFTRTGKRTRQGALADGWNSARRYVLNNFLDGWRQDSIDLFTGNFELDVQQPSPLSKRRGTFVLYCLLVLFLLIATIVSTVVVPTAPTATSRLVGFAFWIVSIVLFWKVLTKFGRKLVDSPLLVQQTA